MSPVTASGQSRFATRTDEFRFFTKLPITKGLVHRVHQRRPGVVGSERGSDLPGRGSTGGCARGETLSAR